MQTERDTHVVQVLTERGWRDLKPCESQEAADLKCEQLTNLSEAHGDGYEYRVLSWMPTLTPEQLAEGDLTAEVR